MEIPIDLEAREGSFVARSLNIGLGGVFVTSDRPFEVGDRFNLRFTLPEQRLSIAVGAEVRWLHHDQGRTSGVGLQFVRLPVPAAAAIQEFLRGFDDDLTPSGPST